MRYTCAVQTQELPTVTEGFTTACYEQRRSEQQPKPISSSLPITRNH